MVKLIFFLNILNFSFLYAQDTEVPSEQIVDPYEIAEIAAAGKDGPREKCNDYVAGKGWSQMEEITVGEQKIMVVCGVATINEPPAKLTDEQIQIVNSFKVVKGLIYILQNLEKRHETVLTILELSEDARNFRVEQRIKETQAITSEEPIDTFSSEIKTNEKIKNRNDYISKIRMSLEKGELKDEYEIDPNDMDDIDIEEDTDDDSDEEDEKENPFKDDKVSDDVFLKYWYCNGKCDSREANEGYNWPANISTRVGYFENLLNKLNKAHEKLEKFKEIFYTKKRDMLPLMQIHDAIKIAISSNRKQVSKIDPINSLVLAQQRLVKKYIGKDGQLKETRGMIVKSSFSKENQKLHNKAQKTIGKLAEYDTAFTNAIKTIREVVLHSYPQKGITIDEDDNEQDLEKDITKSLEVIFGITGALAGTTLCFIIPSFMYLKATNVYNNNVSGGNYMEAIDTEDGIGSNSRNNNNGVNIAQWRLRAKIIYYCSIPLAVIGFILILVDLTKEDEEVVSLCSGTKE